MTNNVTPLIASTLIAAPIDTVWHCWTAPEHMANWNNASEQWHTPVAQNDLRIGGELYLRMERKDGTEGFDHRCIYDVVITNKKISYTTSDNRKSTILFNETGNGVELTETFEPVTTISADMQQDFCQSILNNFKSYTESLIK